MKLWNRVRAALRASPPASSSTATLPEGHLLEANRNLRELLEDTSVPAAVRQALEPEFKDMERLAEKLDREEVHLAVFGRVGTGKSSLCNALIGKAVFDTSPLHGETTQDQSQGWVSFEGAHVELIDTPGIDELDGEARATLALEVARRADVILMVVEGDLTEIEQQALGELAARQRPVLLVLNKSDRYTEAERDTLLQRLETRAAPLIGTGRVIAASADPRPEVVIRVDEHGQERESQRPREPAIAELRDRLWKLLENEGKTLAALNAALFASELDSRIAERIVTARSDMAEEIIRRYCLGKGLAVAVNPVPVADLLAAAGVDVAMVIHLGKLYGHQLSRREASRLLFTIAAQLLALMGAYWGVNLVSSALKTLSAGMTTALTGAAQGALAWYATYVTGKAAEGWFKRGKSWGPDGPRATVRRILGDIDRDSVLLNAREEILERLGKG